MARYWIGNLVSERFPTGFPLGTLIINVSGSLIIGFFLTLVTERMNIHPSWTLAIAVGFVGAYTTFSTFEYETFRLLETGSGMSGLMYIFASLMLGFVAVWGGIAAGRAFSKADILAGRSSFVTAADVRPISSGDAEPAVPSTLESVQDSGSREDP